MFAQENRMDNEAIFFKRVQQGDWAAFTLFFREYTEQLYLYAVAFVKERAAAEDIVQEVFIYFWTNRNKIKYTGSVYAYLLQAVKNSCLNWKAHQEVEEKYRKAALPLEESATSEGEWEELRQKVMEAVNNLPPKCREIFVLGAIEGLKYQKIAEQLDISVNTVKTQMKFAYRKVKEQVGSERDLMVLITLLGVKLFE